VESNEPDDTPLGARERIQLRVQAAELIASAAEATDPAERDRLLAEARALIARADRGTALNGHLG
jgi:hypothetical protein